ncbi:hypothetical protein NQ317_004427 [Molorchus minor]|uniref:Tyr recombinase domain-containing protein n=1 Tax=Molorchus minor TaxID=1323400 RepID=A0ABQ9JPF5_9CUCU|nr:hypothetical protein NQ317_004427 [Molorchus minor]
MNVRLSFQILVSRSDYSPSATNEDKTQGNIHYTCTMNNCESEEIVEAANIAISNLLPTKSRYRYDIAYNRFKKWCAEKHVQVYSENVLLAYFSENAKNYKSSTLWAQYSMVKSCLIIYDNIDISKFPKLIAFLKRTGDGYQAKKSKILTKSEIDRFLSSADDKEFLMIKVGIILGIAGACRTDELVNLTVDDIEDVGSSLIVKIPNTKTKIPRIFVVTDVGNMLELFRKYLSLRPPHGKHKRLFFVLQSRKIASYLKLPDVACYTGHCLRRSSATLLADVGVDITTIKRHAGWKSTTVAEGYVENSIENKTKIANQVLVGTTTSAITKTVNVSESNIHSNINFENCTNVTFNLNVNK